jgi:hypothetical protein
VRSLPAESTIRVVKVLQARHAKDWISWASPSANRLRRYVSCPHFEHATRWSIPNTNCLAVVPGRAIRRGASAAPDAASFPKRCRLGMPIPILLRLIATLEQKQDAGRPLHGICAPHKFTLTVSQIRHEMSLGRGAGGCHELQRRRPVTPAVPPSSLSTLRSSNGDHGGCACATRRRS